MVWVSVVEYCSIFFLARSFLRLGVGSGAACPECRLSTPCCLPGVARFVSLRSCSPPPSRAHGFNVFITCLTRCLIASPLNGAVTVETRNKRPPENEMIKQVTLAKQTLCSQNPVVYAAPAQGNTGLGCGGLAGRDTALAGDTGLRELLP